MSEKNRYIVIFTLTLTACTSFYFIYNETDIQTHPTSDHEPLSEAVALMYDYNDMSFANGASHDGVTFAKYNRISSGMSYEQVCEILGQPGNKTESIDPVAMTCFWPGNEGGVVEIMFENAEVAQKTQTGLNETTPRLTQK